MERNGTERVWGIPAFTPKYRLWGAGGARISVIFASAAGTFYGYIPIDMGSSSVKQALPSRRSLRSRLAYFKMGSTVWRSLRSRLALCKLGTTVSTLATLAPGRDIPKYGPRREQKCSYTPNYGPVPTLLERNGFWSFRRSVPFHCNGTGTERRCFERPVDRVRVVSKEARLDLVVRDGARLWWVDFSCFHPYQGSGVKRGARRGKWAVASNEAQKHATYKVRSTGGGRAVANGRVVPIIVNSYVWGG